MFFLVVHLYSSFSKRPPAFYLRGKFIPKISILAIFGAVSPHFKTVNGKIWPEGEGDLLPVLNYVATLNGIYLFAANLHQ